MIRSVIQLFFWLLHLLLCAFSALTLLLGRQEGHSRAGLSYCAAPSTWQSRCPH